MAQRLPTVAGDSGNWGTILNGFLGVSLASDGSLKLQTWADSTGRPSSAVTTQVGYNVQTGKIEQFDGTNWNSIITFAKADVGLANVDNTSDATKNSATATLTNHRITPRVVSLADAASVSINSDITDVGEFLTLSQSTTMANPTGTPTDGQSFTLRVKSTVSRAWTWGTQFRGSTMLALPSSTAGSSFTEYYQFIWNSADSKWDLLATNAGF